MVRASAAVVALAGAAACTDQSDVSAPKMSVPVAAQPNVLGLVEGKVDASGTVTLTPLGGSGARLAPGVNASVYGTQGVNVLLYATADTIRVIGNRTTWHFRIGARNLLPWQIGTSQNGAAPADTLGLFVAIVDGPTATSGNFCPPGCVSFTSAAGQGFFTAASQPYVYWHQILAPVQPTPGLDTTDTRLPFTFSVFTNTGTNSFRFIMMVGAAWPPPAQTAWNVYYNAATDSLPDTQAEPPWKQTFMQLSSTIGAGTEAWPSKNGLTLSASQGDNIYLYRSDSLDATAMAVMEANLQVSESGTGQILPETVFGLADNTNTLALVGIDFNSVGFVQFGGVFLPTWSFLPGAGTSVTVDPKVPHNYRLNKFGTDSAVLYVDDVRAVEVPYSALPAKPVGATGLPTDATALFGVASVLNTANADWFHVTYTIGADTLGPTHP